MVPDGRRATKRKGSTSMWTIYILQCNDGSFYTGITNNLPHRMKAHALGQGSNYVRLKSPFTLMMSREYHCTRSEIQQLEWHIKKQGRKQKLSYIHEPQQLDLILEQKIKPSFPSSS